VERVNVQIEACIVNHNSSPFSELALRTLVATHGKLVSSRHLAVTVVDNHSADEGLEDLRTACSQLGATFELSSWPLADATVNSHGDVMRDFVATRPDATHYLFVDTDAYCLTEGTVEQMLGEMAADPLIWAVQGRFSWIEENLGAGSSFDLWAGRAQRLRVAVDSTDGMEFVGEHKSRCHPAFALVRNTTEFRRVAEIIGLSAAVVIAANQQMAGFADTFGLATQVMRTHGFRHVLSAATVGHYHGVSYDDPNQPLGVKLDDCRQRLAEARRIA